MLSHSTANFPHHHLQYSLGNIALNCLNWFWFSKIASRTWSSFASPPRGRLPEPDAKGHLLNHDHIRSGEPVVDMINPSTEYIRKPRSSVPLPPRPLFQRYSTWSLLTALCLLRSVPLLSQTMFQPDEFFQSYEPAHSMVYGTGYLTWEWRANAANATTTAANADWLQTLSQPNGRIRAWAWPSLFALVWRIVDTVNVLIPVQPLIRARVWVSRRLLFVT